MKKRLPALLLALSMLAPLPARAAQPETPPVSPWACDAMYEALALGLWEADGTESVLEEITDEQLERIRSIVSDRLALLKAPARAPAPPPAINTTRGGVVNALYRQAAVWDFPEVEADADAVDCLVEMGVLLGRGEARDLALESPCTLQEALVMAQRLVLHLYDRRGAGAQGFLWRAEGNGNTLYLLGTIHVDRDNIYPLSGRLREIIAGADDAIFEVDFGDKEDTQAFLAMQDYPEGEALRDHVSGALFQEAVSVGAALPQPYTMDEAAVDRYKPWAYANLVNSVTLLMGEDSLEDPLAVDIYIYNKAASSGVTVDAVESYVYQGELFDSLSGPYQAGYLSGALSGFRAAQRGDTVSSGVEDISRWVEWWKNGDAASFAAAYGKDEVLRAADELDERLLLRRDPGMIEYADRYLSAEGPRTGILVVGAAHMIGETGVVRGLQALGYTVELAPDGR